jgi:hypothetical protein
MEMEQELREALFQPGELEEMPLIRLLIFLPAKEFCEPDEMAMLERMLLAMKFSSGSWRYIFYEEKADWNLVVEKDAMVLFFASKKDPDQVPLRKEGPVAGYYHLPALSRINADNALKREVWDLLKP